MIFHKAPLLLIVIAGICSPALADQSAPGASQPDTSATPTAVTPANPGGAAQAPAADGAAQPDSPTWSADLFARADVDHNQSVSKTEMTT
jgi:hypothetical protein